MAWPHKGSWRGVPFGTKTVSDEGGSREIIHRYPGRDTQDSESNGLYSKRFRFQAVVGGDGYLDGASELEEALNTPGPGTLIHPRYGERKCVLAEPYSAEISTTELGRVVYTLVFEEVDEQPEPAFQLDTAGLVKANVVLVDDSLEPREFSIEGPSFLQTAVADLLAGPEGVIGKLSAINNKIDAHLNLIDDISGTIDAFASEVGQLIRTPQELFVKLKGLQNSIIGAIAAAGFDTSRNRGDLVNNSARASLALRSASTLSKFGDSHDDVIGTTTVRNQQRKNQREIVDIIEASALAATVGALADIQIDSREQGSKVLDGVNALFDRILERGTISDNTAHALRTLKASYSLHLRRRTVSARGLGRYTPAQTIPALALAYHLYGDSRRAQEIVDINRIAHPLFVPGDVELSIANA